MLFAELVRETFFSCIVIEGTDVHLVTTHSIALNPLILVRMVQPLDRRVAFVAFKSARAVLPSLTILQRLTVLRRILEQVWRASKITRVMRIYATLGVMAVFFCWTPTRFVEEHEEDVALLASVDLIQFLVETGELKQTLGHKVILDALVLKIAVHRLDKLQVGQRETDQFIRGFILIQGDHEWPIESIMTE